MDWIEIEKSFAALFVTGNLAYIEYLSDLGLAEKQIEDGLTAGIELLVAGDKWSDETDTFFERLSTVYPRVARSVLSRLSNV